MGGSCKLRKRDAQTSCSVIRITSLCTSSGEPKLCIMVGLLVSKVLFGFLLLMFFQGCWSRPSSPPQGGCTSEECAVDINCMFINWEYVNCSWTRPKMQNVNYTFSSKLSSKTVYKECPQYLQEHGQNVGCRIPFTVEDQFRRFSTKLSVGRNQSVMKDYDQLLNRVKFNPPNNISVNWTGANGSLCLNWVRSIKQQNCVRYMVQYWRDSKPQVPHKTNKNKYCIPYVSKKVNFTFQVSSKLEGSCGTSDFWSDWSDPVQWGNYTESLPGSPSVSLSPVWLSILGIVVLIALAMLLCYCERIKIFILPVVPDPSKILQDLFREHNGNVESWVHSSRLKEAFETDYTEIPCIVCEPSPTLKIQGFCMAVMSRLFRSQTGWLYFIYAL
uniref:Interleukin 2 receptor, gamma b n=1 Tax=Astyanax mexicanus TaxID=7994 RepID=A0A3B1JY17_ASTMX